jgi:hypothetical protein
MGPAETPFKMRLNQATHLLMFMAVMAVRTSHPGEPAIDSRGHQFIGFDSFGDFADTTGSRSGERVLTSPVVTARIDFTEIIASWNTTLPRDGSLIIEARAVYPEHASRYYTLGLWATDPSQHPRKSVAGQEDPDGNVSTDTLVLRHAARRLQVRLTIAGESAAHPELKFLGISLTDTNFMSSELAPRREAWGKVLAVPERTQMIYPNGKTLCSPTTVSMLMAYWAQILKRPELDRDVPEVAAAIYDSQWQGTGNWPFNMAYAGSFPGVRAYVTRFSDISELEAWIERGLPVGLSVDYDRLRAKGPGPNGHLVVLVGFTTEGDPIINDPGTSKHVRKVFPRRNLFDAWACSRNTVYLVYPQSSMLPEDRFGHWDSPISRGATALSH